MTVTAVAAPERPAHRDPNVLRWLGAYTASMIGDSVYFMALAWAAARTGSASGVGLVLAAGSLPRALLMLGGGVLADRFGPRRIVIGSDAARALLVLGLAAVLFLTAPTVAVLVVVAVLFGAVDALFLPAVGALPPRLTAPGQLARVQGLRALAARGSTIIGAPMGGVAVATGGPSLALAAAGVLFALSLPLLLGLRLRPLPAPAASGEEAATKAPDAWHDLVDGLRYIRRHPLLGPLMLVIALSELGFVGPLNLGLILLSEQRGWGASGMGWIVAGFVSGAASRPAPRRPGPGAARRTGDGCAGPRRRRGHRGPGPGPLGRRRRGDRRSGRPHGRSGLGALCGALVQTAADPAYLGRVTSVSTLFTYAVIPLSYPVTGAAVALWGTGPVYTVSAAVCAVGGVLGLALTALRRAELPR